MKFPDYYDYEENENSSEEDFQSADGSNEELDPQDQVTELLESIVSKGIDSGVIIPKWIVVAEVVSGDSRNLVSFSSDSVSPWDYIGMLKTEADVVSFSRSSYLNDSMDD